MNENYQEPRFNQYDAFDGEVRPNLLMIRIAIKSGISKEQAIELIDSLRQCIIDDESYDSNPRDMKTLFAEIENYLREDREQS